MIPPFFSLQSHRPIFSFKKGEELWWVTGPDGVRHIYLFSLSLLVPEEKDMAALCLVVGPFHMSLTTLWLSAVLLKYL